MSEMNGKVAIVTGGANGIGKASAASLLAQGASVAVFDIDADALDAFDAGDAAERFMPVKSDLSDLDGLPALFDAVLARFGRVDFLINSAAVLGGTLAFEEISPAEWERIFRTNLQSPMMLMQMFARHAVARGGGGRIVNLSSSSAFRASHSKPAYGSAKAALGALTRITASQLGQHDINVNAVAPGITNTPGAGSKRNVDYDAMRKKVTEGPQVNFFGRVSEAEDVAAMIVFLCSQGSRQITGQTIHVNGGAITL